MPTSLISNIPTSLRNRIKKISQPSWVPVMLATLTKKYFSSKEWIYEHKFDGVRCLAFKKNGVVKLLSRNKHSMNESYPELVAALAKQAADNFIIDGEIVSLNKKGVSDFQLLQSRINLLVSAQKLPKKNVSISYNIFDIVYLDGYDLRSLPLLIRKKLLKKVIRSSKMITFTPHIVGDGITFFKKACKLRWEGIIAKDSTSTYVGRRSRDWLKFKCLMGQELVIGGYTTPRGSRSDFGALLVGYYKDDKFLYAGKIGTGFSHETLALLGKKMRALITKNCPFDNYELSAEQVTWIKPKLVAEFQFAQWTRGGKLRVGRYKGLRTDKKAKEVTKEIPKAFGA